MSDYEKVLAEYKAARVAAGTVGDGDVGWSYRNGWYSIGYGNYRRKQVEEMPAELWRRAKVTHGALPQPPEVNE